MNFLIDGLKGWLIQRISAIFMALFFLYFLGYLLFFTPSGFEQWQSWFSAGFNQLLFAVSFVLLLLHGWVGVRDVIFDYIKPAKIQNVLLFTLAVFLMVCAIWMVQILFL